MKQSTQLDIPKVAPPSRDDLVRAFVAWLGFHRGHAIDRNALRLLTQDEIAFFDDLLDEVVERRTGMTNLAPRTGRRG